LLVFCCFVFCVFSLSVFVGVGVLFLYVCMYVYVCVSSHRVTVYFVSPGLICQFAVSQSLASAGDIAPLQQRAAERAGGVSSSEAVTATFQVFSV
jgi:hypothetical protein